MFRRKKIKSNSQFIIENIEAIKEDFFKQGWAELIINYKNSEIVGFFIALNKNTPPYEICTNRLFPTISHELSFDELFNFLQKYNSSTPIEAHTNLMKKHKEYLC